MIDFNFKYSEENNYLESVIRAYYNDMFEVLIRNNNRYSITINTTDYFLFHEIIIEHNLDIIDKNPSHSFYSIRGLISEVISETPCYDKYKNGKHYSTCSFYHSGVLKNSIKCELAIKFDLSHVTYICKSIDSIAYFNNEKKENRKKQYKKKYIDYIKSFEWRLKRNQVLIQAGYKCEKCGNRENLSIHHLNYNTLFNENLNDLICVCKKCHKEFHAKPLQ